MGFVNLAFRPQSDFQYVMQFSTGAWPIVSLPIPSSQYRRKIWLKLDSFERPTGTLGLWQVYVRFYLSGRRVSELYYQNIPSGNIFIMRPVPNASRGTDNMQFFFLGGVGIMLPVAAIVNVEADTVQLEYGVNNSAGETPHTFFAVQSENVW